MKARVIATILVSITAFSGSLSAQLPESNPDSLDSYATDSLYARDTAPRTCYADRPLDTTWKTTNPTTALFKSLFVPGWGQLCNKKYIKAGVVITLEALLIGTVAHYAKKTSSAKEAFEAETDIGEKARLFNEFEEAKDQRNRFSWFTGTLVFLSMFDAYVDAHLAEFPVCEEKLSFDFSPTSENSFRATISYKF
jgi:hypothetical protein